jgi:molecular chaperone GrpE
MPDAVPEEAVDETTEVTDAGADAGPEEELAVEEALERAERERDEYLDHLRRERAEFENFRKRVTRERMDALDRGAEQVVANLLGVLDNLRLALDAADAHPDDQLSKGVEMVHSELVGVLRQAGLEEVPGVGAPFDPAWHEAMGQEDAEEPADEPVVVQVYRPGYRFKGRVLRPASVKVAK